MALCEGCRSAVLTIEQERNPVTFVRRTEDGTHQYTKHLCEGCIEEECRGGAIEICQKGRP